MILCLNCGHQNRNDHLFCTQCGRRLSERAAVSAKLVAMNPPKEGQYYPLSLSPVYLGRTESNDIIVKDDRVSGQHAKLSFEESQFWIEDLDSTNGTYVNGERLTKKRSLKDEDLIKIGATILKFKL